MRRAVHPARPAHQHPMMFAEGIVVSSPLIISLVIALGSAIALLFKMVISSKDKQLADMESQKKSWEEIANEGVKSAKETADFYRAKEGLPPIILAAPVISESHSPSTAKQRETAAIATKRASLAQIKLMMQQPPRVEPEHAAE